MKSKYEIENDNEANKILERQSNKWRMLIYWLLVLVGYISTLVFVYNVLKIK